jgi:immune inhibitor A
MRHRNRPIPGADDRCLHERCKVAPSPEAQARLRDTLREVADRAGLPAGQVGLVPLDRGGYNDGMIRPGTDLPLGTPLRVARRGALERAPLRGEVRVLVVLVDFSDKAITATPQHFKDLFFSTGKLPHGSVREFFKEVSSGKITITGEVVGPFRMPLPLATYAGGGSGTDNPAPNARTLAREAAMQADAVVDFKPYDNDGNGFVDAFIVVHAGRGAEETLDPNDLWSHKWVFNNGALNADGTKVYGYLTVPEDCKIGVCAHELGHLLFGWPDLYDTDESSSGLGNWCLMAGGSWNGNGDIPAHPSAWCKSSQDWVTTVNRTTAGSLTIAEVKTGRKIYRLWKDGLSAQEYFLVENRAKTKFDAGLPGEGLLIYHVDDSVDGNDNEHHPQVKLIEADGRTHLKDGTNRGDAGDVFPGTSNNANFTATTIPNSLSYSGLETCVSLTSMVKSGTSIKAKVSVSCPLHVAPPPLPPKPATRKATNTRKTKKTKPTRKARPTKKTKPAKRARPAKKTRPTRKAKPATKRRRSKRTARR